MRKISDKAIELYAEATALAHAVQTGVKYQMEIDLEQSGTSPKSLRVGVNMAMVEHGALAEALIAKGILSDEEYLTALVEKTREEKERYEAILSKTMGDVKLA